jgi:hypothetical protein
LRDAGSRATKAFYPALSLCDMIFSGVFERQPRLMLAIVEFGLAWVPDLLRRIPSAFACATSSASTT